MRPLEERLAALRGRPAPSAADTADLTARIRRLQAGRRSERPDRGPVSDEADLACRLGARRLEPGLLLRERRLPGLRPPGGALPADLLAEAGGAGGWLLLDTETTGLAGGCGTLPFLIGTAVQDDAGISLRQYLITGFAAEAAMLAALTRELAGARVLVTYNGKSFDLPLLRTRYRLHGLADPFGGLGHLDLLHPVRRRYRGRWPDCRLTTAERHLLGTGREQDLPGAEAPRAWLDYLKNRRWSALAGVLRHNEHDLASLASLPAVLDGAARPSVAAAGVALPARERLRALRAALA